MYKSTQNKNQELLSSQLINVAKQHFPYAEITCENSETLYDTLMREAVHEHFEDFNESYIMQSNIGHETLEIEIVCLHTQSLKLTLNCKGICNLTEHTSALLSDIKILALSEVIRYQSKMFSKISENTWQLLSGSSHEKVIRNVIDGALKTISFSDAAIFRIYDEKSDSLIPLAISGFEENYYNYAVSLNESISGRVFQDKKTCIINSKDEILSSFKTYSPVRAEILKNNPVATSLLCVPVYDQHSCYGTLTLLSFSRQFVFNSLAQSLLEMYSSQVAIAWRNAILHAERNEHLTLVEGLRGQLEKQNRQLNLSVSLYNRLINLSIKYNKICEIITAISQETGIEINYMDGLGNHKTNKELLPFRWQEMNTYEPESDRVIKDFPHDDFEIFPLKNEGRTLAIFIIHKSHLDENALTIITRIKDFILMEILKKASSIMLENKRTQNIIERLLNNGINDDIASSLYKKGFTLQSHHFFTKIKLSKFEMDDLTYITYINDISASLNVKNMICYYENNIINIITSDYSESRLEILSDKLKNQAFLSGDTCIGISNILLSHDIKKTQQQASTALAVLETRKKNGLMYFKNSGVDKLLAHHSNEDIKNFISETFFPVLNEDGSPGQLLQTIMCLIKNNQSVSHTANELDIHVNTLYQRLKKFELMTKLSLSNPDEFLMISLSCHMVRFYMN